MPTQREMLPSMCPSVMADWAEDWLSRNIGWHRTIGVAIGVSEDSGEWPDLKQLGRALKRLGDDRVVNRGNLVTNGREDRTRMVWSYNRYES